MFISDQKSSKKPKEKLNMTHWNFSFFELVRLKAYRFTIHILRRFQNKLDDQN